MASGPKLEFRRKDGAVSGLRTSGRPTPCARCVKRNKSGTCIRCSIRIIQQASTWVAFVPKKWRTIISGPAYAKRRCAPRRAERNGGYREHGKSRLAAAPTLTRTDLMLQSTASEKAIGAAEMKNR